MKLNLTQKIACNAFFSAGGRVVEVALAFLIIKLIVGYLGESGFGDYIIVVAFIYIFSVFADLGLYSIVVREISREGADEKKIINNAFTLRLTAGFFILGIAYFVSLLFPYSNNVQYGIAVAALGFWILSNIQVLMGLFQKHLAMEKVAIAEISGRAIQLFFVWYFIAYDFGFLYIISAIFLGAVINFILVLRFASRFIKIKLAFDFKFWKKLLIQSYPLAISAILVLIYFKLDTIFLSVMKTSEAVGVYGLSYKILENLIFFPAMIVGLTMPIMSKYIFTDRNKFKSVVQRTLNFLIIAFVPIAFGAIMTSDKIIGLFTDKGFYDSPMVLNILIIALGFIFLGALFSNIIIAANQQKRLAQIYFIGMIFNVITNLIFIPKYSYFGAAATTVATEFLVTGLMLYVIYKTINFIPSFLKILFKALSASLLMALVLSYFSYLNIFFLAIIGVAVYLPAVYLVGGISKEEIGKLTGRG
jgi:O-antigen/teichoic acid export membrane protein